jgi:hypothetical protein
MTGAGVGLRGRAITSALALVILVGSGGAGCLHDGSVRRGGPSDLFSLYGAAASYHERMATEQALAMLTQVLDAAAAEERRFRARQADGELPEIERRAAVEAVAELAMQRLADLATEVPLAGRIGSRMAGWRRDLPLPAVQVLLKMWAQMQKQAGDDAAAAATQAARGCLLGFSAAGPFGRQTLADHDRPFGPERPAGAPSAAAVHEGERPSGPARVMADGPRCRLVVDGPEQRAGIYYLRTQVTLARPTWVLLRASSDDPIRVDVGGTPALDLDRRRAYLPEARIARILLGAGTTDITLKLASQGAETAASVFLTDEAGGSLAGLSSRPPQPTSAGSAAAGSWVGRWRAPWETPFGCDPRRLTGPGGVWTRPALACLQRARAASRGGAGPGKISGAGGEGRPGVTLERSSGTDALLAALLRQDGETDLVRPLLDQLLAERPSDGALLQLRGESWLEDPSLGNRVARDRARRDLEEALRYEPWRARARFLLGTLEAQETGKTELALAHLEKAALEARHFEPHGHYSLWLQRFDLYREKGWEREAREVAAEARRINPAGCRAIEVQADLSKERGDLAGLDRQLAELARCDRRTPRLAERLRDRGDAAGALALYQRLLAQPEAHRNGTAHTYDDLVVEAAQLERGLGRLDAAVARLRQRLAVHPRSLWLRRALADALLEQGRREQARGLVTQGLELRPSTEELRVAARTLGLPGPMQELRLDGVEVIRDYEKRGAPVARGPRAAARRLRRGGASGGGAAAAAAPGGEASGAAVYLLDRTVVRVYPDGSSVQLVHNIIKVLSKAGADKHGEVEIPEHAEVLTLRTVKQDGTVLEPESIPAKETVSVPDLGAGDYVEFEYQEMQGPREVLGRGYLSDRFYFRTFDAPLDRSEFVVVAPTGVQLDEDVRGDVQITRKRAGDLTLHTYSRRQNARLLPEPAAPNMEDFVPSVRVAVRVSWEAWAQQLRADALATSRPNHELRKLAATLASPGGPDARHLLDTALRDYRWVTRHIEGKGDDGATTSLARRAGNRLALLRALLDAQGIPYELLYARPRVGQVPPARIPEPELYGAAFIRVRDERGLVLELDPRWRYAPAGFLAPTLSTARALRVPKTTVGPHSQVRWETLRPLDSRGVRQVWLLANVAADGSATVHGREILTGWPALEWRESLAQNDIAQIEKSFEERSLAGPFPGAQLESLAFEQRDNPAVPLVVKYRFKVGRLGRVEGNQLVLPGSYFPTKVAPNYATLQARTLPIEIGIHPRIEVTTDLILPAGARPLNLPAPAETQAQFGGVTGRYRLAMERGATGPGAQPNVRVQSVLDLPPTKVKPAEYSGFARWAGAIDNVETRELRIRLK